MITSSSAPNPYRLTRETILAPPVGVFVTPAEEGPILASPVGVFVTPTTDGPILAPPVGVCVDSILAVCP